MEIKISSHIGENLSCDSDLLQSAYISITYSSEIHFNIGIYNYIHLGFVALGFSEEKRNAHRVLVGKPEGKRPLGTPRRRWENNIKMDLR
jgi:hypothetical protein